MTQKLGLTKLALNEDVEQRIQALAARDGIRIEEFFIDFDKLRKGTVGDAAFRTCIGTLGIKLTQEEVQSLVQKYTMGQGLINYKDFCNHINGVFYKPTPADKSQVIHAAKSTAVFTQEEQEAMLQHMKDLNFQVVSNRILLKPTFMDFDRSKSQHITSAQFLRVMKTLSLMPANEKVFDLLIRKYCDKGTTKEVNYYHFCKDVDKPEDMFPPYIAKKPVAEKYTILGKTHGQYSTFFDGDTAQIDVLNNRFSQQRVDILCDPNDAEDRIRAMVVMKRIRIEEFFYDFDKLRKGRVTKHQFKAILSSMNLNLTENEFESLHDKYQTNDPEKFFNYKAFIANINKAFTIKGIDKNPETIVAPIVMSDTLLARRKYLGGRSEEEEIQPILEEYRTAVQNKRIHLKPVFQDFDITKNGHVTKAQFLRVLDLLKIAAPDNITMMLLRRYMDKGNLDEVNYVDFCEDVDNETMLFGVGRDFNHSFDYYPKTMAFVSTAEIVRNTPQCVEDCLARLRVLCKQQRIRIGEFFRDFDKLRSSYITKSQFRIGLNMAKVQISSQEFELLAKEFKAPKEGDHVMWKDFVDRVDEVFTKKHLEKDNDIDLNDVRTQTIYSKQEPTEQDCQEVKDIVERFKEVIRKNRLEAKSFFQDFDKHVHFKVSQKIFRQVLTHLGFNLTVDEVAKIGLVYGNEVGEIKYAEFLKDCSCLEYTINGPTTGIKSTYLPKDLDFTGVKEHEKLMHKIQCMIKKDRVRLQEFFQDHDLLRKGYVPAQKFRSVLHSQKIKLTIEEYVKLESFYSLPTDSNLINYKDFCDHCDVIFTEKDLEREPLKKPAMFLAPSILDPKDVLNADEERELDETLQRLGVYVRDHRLLIKPFFQDKDKSRSGFVMFSRFKSIFDNFKLQLNKREYELIQKRFAAKAANEINYVEFDFVLRKYSGDDKPY